MNASSSPFSLPDTAPELARRLGVILAGLAGLVARRFLRMPHLVGLTVLLWGRLNRAVRRFDRVLARRGVGRAARVRAARADRVRARSLGLPSGRGWLVRELGYEAVGYGSQLAALLADPAMQAALAAMPQAGRILRPLCRMLGLPAAIATPVPVAATGPVMELPLAEVRRDWPAVALTDLGGVTGNCPGHPKSR